MIDALKLAGFLAAHTLMSIENGDRHIVNYGYVDAQGKEHAQRIKQGLLTKNIKIGQSMLVKPTQNAAYAALIYNCMGDLMYVPPRFPDAENILVVEVKSYTRAMQAIFGLRYGSANGHLNIIGFEIYSLPETVKKNAFLKAFRKGFSEHEFGAKVCTHIDLEELDVCRIQFNAEYLNFFYEISFGSDGILERDIPLSSISKKFDDVCWHYGDGLPEGYEENVLGVHIGIFAIWCALNGLAGDSLKRKIPAIKKMYENRTNAPGKWCIEKMDGKLTNEDMNDLGNSFAYEYYDEIGAAYFTDYFDAVEGDGNEYAYSIPDTWETYDKVAPVIARRYQEWQAKTKE